VQRGDGGVAGISAAAQRKSRGVPGFAKLSLKAVRHAMRTAETDTGHALRRLPSHVERFSYVAIGARVAVCSPWT
jgi:hypothetical protein